MKNRSSHLGQSIEGGSTGYDHFRHVYEFVQALYNSLNTNHVDYDSRARDSITKDNFVQKQQEFDTMVSVLSNDITNHEITITAQKTYPGFQSITSLQREILELLDHEENHYRYLDSAHKIIPQKEAVYSVHQKKEISLINIENIQQDIQQDISRYQPIPIEYLFDATQQAYHTIITKLEQLSQYDTDDLLVFNHAITSVSNEYYKIEEELVHLLYDIRLYLKKNNQELFEELVEKDPDFGIARSTLQSLIVSQ